MSLPRSLWPKSKRQAVEAREAAQVRKEFIDSFPTKPVDNISALIVPNVLIDNGDGTFTRKQPNILVKK